MYIVQVAVWEFSPYTHICRLIVYCFWLYNSMLGLNLLLNKEELILDAWLSQRLVFDNEIAT